ncbi:hypothetical protein LC593_04935 [Nostoc sp. CHAB 5844]|nr:hypothetical protein [Nostoc sp. CHAB 5844]
MVATAATSSKGCIAKYWHYYKPITQIYRLWKGVDVLCDVSPSFAILFLTTEIRSFLQQSLNNEKF